MKINILDNVFECSNTIDDVKLMLKKVDEVIESSNLILTCIVINEAECYNNFYENIINNLEEIEEIQVILKSSEEVMNEISKDTCTYIKNILVELEELIDAFYMEDGPNLWNKFVKFLDDLESIIQTINFSLDNFEEYSKTGYIKVEQEKLSSYIKELGEAMEQGDKVCISDLIIYEIKPILTELNSQINMSIL